MYNSVILLNHFVYCLWVMLIIYFFPSSSLVDVHFIFSGWQECCASNPCEWNGKEVRVFGQNYYYTERCYSEQGNSTVCDDTFTGGLLMIDIIPVGSIFIYTYSTYSQCSAANFIPKFPLLLLWIWHKLMAVFWLEVNSSLISNA